MPETTKAIECEGCPGNGEAATRTYRDQDGALVRYCDDCGELAEMGWNGRTYERVETKEA